MPLNVTVTPLNDVGGNPFDGAAGEDGAKLVPYSVNSCPGATLTTRALSAGSAIA